MRGRLLRFLGSLALAGAVLPSASARLVAPSPALSLPPDSIVQTPHPLGAVVTFSASATDWKGRRLPVRCTPASGSVFALGKTVVTCTATDRRGRATAGTFAVVVVTAPAAAAPEPTADAGGAVVTAPVRIAWHPAPRAAYYNLQLFRVAGGEQEKTATKILSVWPAEPRFTLSDRWTYEGRRHRLSPGTYRWYVWPGFGPRAERRYGPLLQQGAFVVPATTE